MPGAATGIVIKMNTDFRISPVRKMNIDLWIKRADNIVVIRLCIL